jgi:hypothetical protein
MRPDTEIVWWQDRREPSRQHRLAAARWTDEQHVVRAGGRDLQRPLGVRLPANVREIEIVRDSRGCWRCRGDCDGIGAVEDTDRIAQGRRGEHFEAVDGEGLGVVRERHDERGDSLSPAREPDGQYPTHPLNLAVQSQLAHHRKWADRTVLDHAHCPENSERDR